MDKNVKKVFIFLSANMKTCHILADVVVNLITSIIFGPLTIQLLEKTATHLSNEDFCWNNETLELITW